METIPFCSFSFFCTVFFYVNFFFFYSLVISLQLFFSKRKPKPDDFIFRVYDNYKGNKNKKKSQIFFSFTFPFGDQEIKKRVSLFFDSLFYWKEGKQKNFI